MSETKLARAKEMIQEKRYEEARTLLKTINHPTATKWLAKLEEITPPEPEEDEIVPPSLPSREPVIVSWMTVAGALVMVVLLIMVVYQQIQLNNLLQVVGVLGTDLTSVRTLNATNDGNTLVSRVETLETDIAELVTVVNSHATDINSLSFDLRSVASVADNANRYAHEHGFSDIGLKTDISEIDSPLERILSVRGIFFMWNGSAFPDLNLETGYDYGVLAQEVRDVFPELVTPDPATGLLRVDYDGLIPVIIEAIREQQQQIDELQELFTGLD